MNRQSRKISTRFWATITLIVALGVVGLSAGCGRSSSSSTVGAGSDLFARKVKKEEPKAEEPEAAAEVAGARETADQGDQPDSGTPADSTNPPQNVGDRFQETGGGETEPEAPGVSVLPGEGAELVGVGVAGSGGEADSLAGGTPAAGSDSVLVATESDSLALVDSLGIADSEIAEADKDWLRDYEIPDVELGAVSFETSSEIHSRGTTHGLWNYTERLQPSRDVFLYKLADRIRSRELLLDGDILSQAEKTKIDTVPFRALQPTVPEMKHTQATEKVAHQVHFDPEDELIRITHLYSDGDTDMPVSMSIDEYTRRLTKQTTAKLWADIADQELQRSDRRSSGGLVEFDIPVAVPSQLQGIFGQGAPNLKVSGSERISFSGNSQWFPNRTEGEFGRKQSKFPQLNMEQQLNLKLSGTIGDKVHVDVDQSSESSSPLANRIKIHYQGYDDEIIQRVDLGNTSLRLPGNYVGFSGRVEGLFGVNTLAKLGDVDFNAILTKQEGRNASKSIRASAETTPYTKRDYQFKRAQYFFLRDPDGCPWELDPATLQVFVDNKNAGDNAALGAIPATATPEGEIPDPGADDAHTGSFHPLFFGEDYSVQTDIYTGHPVLILRRALSEQDYLAVVYRGWKWAWDGQNWVRNGTLGAGEYGTTNSSPLLKMVRASLDDSRVVQSDLRAGVWGKVSRLELRNVYDVGGRNIESIQASIHHLKSTGTNTQPDRLDDGTTFLQLTGLDLSLETDQGLEPGNDNLIDAEFINLGDGILILPDLRPFDPDSTDLCLGPIVCDGDRPYCRFDPDSNERKAARPRTEGGAHTWTVLDPTFRAPGIYDVAERLITGANSEDYSRYELRFVVSSPVSQIILDAFNLLAGSERVTANGRVLVRDSHYTIDYELGQIEILDAAGITQEHEISVDYSFVPFGGGGSQKTLAGIAAYIDPQDRKWNFSSTWLYESKGGVPGNEGFRPRLGEEPSRTLVGEFAAGYKTDSWWMTDMTDNIPFITARAPSRFEIDGGVGLSFPNPNTRNQLYIDDFEGAKDVLTLNLSRRFWKFPSIPLRLIEEENGSVDEAAGRKGELIWYGPRRALQSWDLQPTLDEREGDDNRPVLEWYFGPRGDTDRERSESWVGVTYPISSSLTDLSRSQFIDIWVNDGIPYELRHLREGILHLDLGIVSEDAQWNRNDLWDGNGNPSHHSEWLAVKPNTDLDTEDANGDEILDRNQTTNEDIGLDGVLHTDADTTQFKDFDLYSFAQDSDQEEYQPIDFRFVNGSEDNQALDTEDLDGNGTEDFSNRYFEIQIDLSDSTLWETDVRRDFVVNDPGASLTRQPADSSGWRRIRVSLANSELVKAFSGNENEPVWTDIKHARLWATGFTEERVRLQVGGMEITGNRWFQKPITDLKDVAIPPESQIPDEAFFIGVVNNKDDQAIYSPPFKVRKQTGENVDEREQSITMELRNLQPGHRVTMYRTFPRAQNYSSLYQTLEFYMNRRFVAGDADLLASIRLSKDSAIDTDNYYEYRVPVPDQWNLVKIDMAELARLQLEEPDSLSGVISRTLPDGAVISRKGNPSLTEVRRITFMISNLGRHPLSEGAVWFDELRLSGVQKDTGVAGRVSMTANLSDVANFNANYEHRGADFLSIGQDRGTGTTTKTTNFSGTINLHKFVERYAVNLPMRLTFRNSQSVPKFQTNSDLIVQTPTDRDITESKNQSMSINYSKRPSENPMIRYFVDPFKVSASRTRSVQLSPTRRDTTVSRTGNVSWALNLARAGRIRLPNRSVLSIFKRPPEIQLLPTTLSWGLSGGDTKVRQYTRSDLSAPYVRERRPDRTTSALTLGARLQPITLLTYSIDSSRNLNLQQNQLTIAGLNLGRETRRHQDVQATWSPPILRTLLSPSLNWKGQSNLDLLKQEGQQEPGEPDRHNTYTNSNTTGINGRIGVGEFMRVIKKIPRPGAKPDSVQSRRGRGWRGEVQITDISVNYSFSTNTSYTRRKGEPSIAYQLGLVTDPGDQVIALSNNRETVGRTRNLDLNTSVRLPQKLSVKARYNRRKNEGDQNGGKTFSRELSWPDLDISWGTLHKALGLERLLRTKSFTANTRYTKKSNISGPIEEVTDKELTTTSYSPLLRARLSFASGLELTLDTSRIKTRDEQFQPSFRLTESSNTQANLSAKKSWRLNKRVKVPGSNQTKVINTRMSVDGNVTWRKQSRSSQTVGAPVTASGNTEFRVGAGSTYGFTERISGSARLEFGHFGDEKNEANSRRTITMSVSAAFTF